MKKWYICKYCRKKLHWWNRIFKHYCKSEDVVRASINKSLVDLWDNPEDERWNDY